MNRIPALPTGASYIPDFIDGTEHLALACAVDKGIWETDLRRRVQHYGYQYDYRARRVTRDSYLGPLPDWASELAERLTGTGWLSSTPDQLIVNEYLPGQGISAHVDCVPCFGETIASISLLSDCIMKFRNADTREQSEIVLEPRSALVLSGAARFDWTHEIPGRKSDIIGGKRTLRSRRISLTFRTVLAV